MTVTLLPATALTTGSGSSVVEQSSTTSICILSRPGSSGKHAFQGASQICGPVVGRDHDRPQRPFNVGGEWFNPRGGEPAGYLPRPGGNQFPGSISHRPSLALSRRLSLMLARHRLKCEPQMLLCNSQN